MNRTSIALNKQLLCGLFIGMMALLLLPPGEADALASAQHCGQWGIVASPDVVSMDVLYGIAAISPQDVWAVGRYVNTQNQALIEHWNGKRWSIVASPDPALTGSYLLGIKALSSTDVWAVGATYVGNSSSTLIIHWDGTDWKVVPSPGAGALYAVTALSSTNVWAVGANAGQTLIEQWNGTQWNIIPSPNPGKFGNGLTAVTAISSTDIWAVGAADTTEFGFQSLVEHWNGKQWHAVKSPSPSQFPYDLRAVSVCFCERYLGRGQLYNSSWRYPADPHRTLGWENMEYRPQPQSDGR